MKKRKRLALLFGGAGAEHNVSLMSAKYIRTLIDRQRFNTLPIFIDRDGRWYAELKGALVPVTLKREKRVVAQVADKVLPLDCAFPMLHGDFGEDGRVQGLLDCLGLPYVGEGVRSGAVCADKHLCKLIAAALGIKSADSVLIDESMSDGFAARLIEERIGYPVILKPASLGSSVGIEAVRAPAELQDALVRARRRDKRILAEVLLEDIREIECGILRIGKEILLTKPGEVKAAGVYDYDKKYRGAKGVEIIDTAELTERQSEQLREYCLRLTEAIGIRQIGRFDFFLTKDEIYLNEINTMPGMTEGSLYPRMLSASGISPFFAINSLIEECMLP